MSFIDIFLHFAAYSTAMIATSPTAAAPAEAMTLIPAPVNGVVLLLGVIPPLPDAAVADPAVETPAADDVG